MTVVLIEDQSFTLPKGDYSGAVEMESIACAKEETFRRRVSSP